jgi:endo-1,4-beta-xylanase
MAILIGLVMWGVTASAQNLLQNPGFESGTTGWGRWGPRNTEIATTNFAHSGQGAARVSNRTATSSGITTRIRSIVVPGATYRCSGWVRLENGGEQPVKLIIRQIDGETTERQRNHDVATNTTTSDGWVELSGLFTLNVVGTFSDLHLYFHGPDPGINFLVDDVAVALVSAPEQTAQYLLQNSGFEWGATGWGWRGWGPVEIATTNFPHSGRFSARVWNRAERYSGIGVTIKSLVVPGATYRCSGWVRLEDGPDQPVKMTLRQIDGGNNARPRYRDVATNKATSDGWVELSGAFTLNVVGTLSNLHLFFQGPDPGVNFLVDDVSFALVSVPKEPVVAERPGDRGQAPPVRSVDLTVKLILIGAVIPGLIVMVIVLAGLLAFKLWKKHTASRRSPDDVPEPPLIPPRDGPGS